MKEFIEKLIGRLEEEQKKQQYLFNNVLNNDNQRMFHAYAEQCYLYMTEIVKELAEEYNDGWIPCDKELPPQPEENPLFDNKALELYLVSDGYSDYPFRAFWNGKFFVDGFSSVDVIAWQPLPPAFEPKGE